MLKQLLIIIISYSIGNLPAQAVPTKNPEIKIAIIAPLSGAYADYGTQLLLAATRAIQDLHPNHTNLNVIPFDDQCNYANAISIANHIIKDPKIKAIIGHTCSANNLIANKIYAKYGILHLIPTATNHKITANGAINLFRITGKDDVQAYNISNFLAKNFTNKKIAILHPADFYNQQLAELVQESLAMFKIAPTLYQSINQETFDNYIKFKHIIKKIQKLNIDVIFFSGFYKDTAQLIKFLHYSKIKIPVIATDGIATPGFIKSLKDPNIAAGTIMSFPKIATKDLNLTGQALLGYAAMQIIITAIQHNLNINQSLSSRSLANWLHHNKVSTVLGEKSWDTNGDIIDPGFAWYVWDYNGNYHPLT